MSNTRLLDTNAAVALLNGDAVLASYIHSKTIMVSSIVLGELHYGAENSGKRDDNLRKVIAFAERYPVLSCDRDTARIYGALYSQLRKKGRTIPQNDVWIAAITKQHDLTLLTRDRHFDDIEGLLVENWQT